MEVKIRYLEGQKFIAEASGHKIIIDQPKEKGGSDEGMNPLELFLSALGSCAAFYAKNYCKNASIDTKNLEVNVSSILTTEKPFRFQDIDIRISLGQDIKEREKALISFVENCPVRNTIKASPKVNFMLSRSKTLPLGQE